MEAHAAATIVGAESIFLDDHDGSGRRDPVPRGSLQRVWAGALARDRAREAF
jgi:hypothetical protein